MLDIIFGNSKWYRQWRGGEWFQLERENLLRAGEPSYHWVTKSFYEKEKDNLNKKYKFCYVVMKVNYGEKGDKNE